jgi:hypothetical protein
MATEFIEAFPRVRFGRKLYQEVTYDAELVRVRGEWEPDEPEGWEVFTVMLHGSEAGDFIEAKIDDLRKIVAAYDA